MGWQARRFRVSGFGFRVSGFGNTEIQWSVVIGQWSVVGGRQSSAGFSGSSLSILPFRKPETGNSKPSFPVFAGHGSRSIIPAAEQRDLACVEPPGAFLFQPLDLLAKRLDVLEAAVNRGEPDVCHLVEPGQLGCDPFADGAAGHLGLF